MVGWLVGRVNGGGGEGGDVATDSVLFSPWTCNAPDWMHFHWCSVAGRVYLCGWGATCIIH